MKEKNESVSAKSMWWFQRGIRGVSGGYQRGIRVVSGWYQRGIRGVSEGYQGGIRGVSGWYQRGIRVVSEGYQGGIRVVPYPCMSLKHLMQSMDFFSVENRM